MKSSFEKYRIILSRIAAGAGFILLCSIRSYWDVHNELIASLLYCIGIVLAAIASLGRMWCSLYIAGYKNNKLVQMGPYSICRNPLYFFSLLGVVGVGFATETIIFPILFALVFIFYYPAVIKGEEKRLASIFGDEFEEYKKRVPSFFPKFSLFKEPDNYCVNPAIYRGHIFSALWFIWIVGLLEIFEVIRQMGFYTPLWLLY